MEEINVKVQKVGNSLMVVVPKPLAQKLKLEEGDEVSVARENKTSDAIKIKPIRRRKYEWKDVIGSISIPNFKMSDVLRALEEEYGR